MNAFKYIDILVNFILAIVNFILRLHSKMILGMNKVLKRNEKLRELKGSEECFIIGNGPSLKNIDLSKLNGKDTICVNYFYNQSEVDFKSKYYLAIDELFLQGEANNYIKDVYYNNPEMIMLLRYDFIKDKTMKWDERTYFLYSKQFQYGDVVKYDCTKVMTSCINVVLQCIQVALYMGYKRIYLLGCDFNQYAQLKPNHFYNSEDNRICTMGNDARWSSMVHFHHYALRRIAEKKGVQIINLTEGSLIDAYPRMNYQDVVK